MHAPSSLGRAPAAGEALTRGVGFGFRASSRQRRWRRWQRKQRLWRRREQLPLGRRRGRYDSPRRPKPLPGLVPAQALRPLLVGPLLRQALLALLGLALALALLLVLVLLAHRPPRASRVLPAWTEVTR